MATYVGLDVHLRTCHATVMDERGKILRQEKFPNEKLELERILVGIDDAKVAMEACYCWQSDELERGEVRRFGERLDEPK